MAKSGSASVKNSNQNTGGRDKQSVKAASKNAKTYRKMQRKNRQKRRNSYVAAARYVAAAIPFSVILVNGVVDARRSGAAPDSYLLPALASFFLVWFVLGFAERAISLGIQKLALDEREAQRARDAELRAALNAAEAAVDGADE
jgi:hypothetical protein